MFGFIISDDLPFLFFQLIIRFLKLISEKSVTNSLHLLFSVSSKIKIYDRMKTREKLNGFYTTLRNYVKELRLYDLRIVFCDFSCF